MHRHKASWPTTIVLALAARRLTWKSIVRQDNKLSCCNQKFYLLAFPSNYQVTLDLFLMLLDIKIP